MLVMCCYMFLPIDMLTALFALAHLHRRPCGESPPVAVLLYLLFPLPACSCSTVDVRHFSLCCLVMLQHSFPSVFSISANVTCICYCCWLASQKSSSSTNRGCPSRASSTSISSHLSSSIDHPDPDVSISHSSEYLSCSSSSSIDTSRSPSSRSSVGTNEPSLE